MKKIVFLSVLSLLSTLLFAEDLHERPVNIPVYYPYSDALFAASFSNYLEKYPSFFYQDFYGDLISIPDDVDYYGEVVRMAASIGSLIPMAENLSGIASVNFALDNVYVAQSMNLFTGAGVLGQYDSYKLGLLAGYYMDRYQELPERYGTYNTDAILDDQPASMTNAVRFVIISNIELLDKIPFLNNIGGHLNISEKAEVDNFEGKLSFRRFLFWVLGQVGIDIYYGQNPYNILLEQKLSGAKFETKHISIDVGHRQFVNASSNSFSSNYKDGYYSKFIYKFEPIPVIISYGFEQTFKTQHFFGVGISFAPDNWINDFHYEFSDNMDMRFVNSNVTTLERYFK